jgi:hypothetical protein
MAATATSEMSELSTTTNHQLANKLITSMETTHELFLDSNPFIPPALDDIDSLKASLKAKYYESAAKVSALASHANQRQPKVLLLTNADGSTSAISAESGKAGAGRRDTGIGGQQQVQVYQGQKPVRLI